jgi:hypothetical protein
MLDPARCLEIEAWMPDQVRHEGVGVISPPTPETLPWPLQP